MRLAWLVFLLLLPLSCVAVVATCHPKADPNQTQYIVGYGSLMNQASKQSSLQTAGKSLPVLIKGFTRGWIVPADMPGHDITFLGAAPERNKIINAVIFSLPKISDLANYDRRERGYCRVQVQAQDLTMLAKQKLPTGQFWIYALPKTALNNRPTAKAPIVQSYVDLFLSGCLQMQKQFDLKNFAKQCIDTTSGWNKHWINDRIHPRRPFVHQPDAWQIDHLLKQNVPAQFAAIKIE